MRRFVVLVSLLFGLHLLMGCSGDGEGGAETKDFGAGGTPEMRSPCTEEKDCDDGNPCTIDHCHEGFCDPEFNPIDADLDGYVSPVCGGPDCDDGDETIHPAVLEAPYGESICFDGKDNDCDGLVDEEDAGCFHCETAGDCEDGNPCTLQSCVQGRCAYTDRAGPCDDGDPCTVNDACFLGVCSGDPLDADLDGYVDAGCGGEDCDDTLAGVHPGAREGPPADFSCRDGVDNDCDGEMDAGELACQGDNQVIRLTIDESLAPAETDLSIDFAVGTFQNTELIRIAYSGDVDTVYDPAEERIWVEDLSLAVDPVSAGIQLPLGGLTVALEAFRVAMNDREDLILDPEGFFTAHIRLRIDAVASVHLNALAIIEDYPLSLLSDDTSVSGRWINLGDTDGDGLQEFDFLVAGPVSYGFPAMEIPLLGPVSATIRGEVELGFHGEGLAGR